MCEKSLMRKRSANTVLHVYEKAGFKKVEQILPKFDPAPHWMMCLNMSDLT